MMKLNKTKIIATLGPASSSKTMMSKLISSGVDVFRINFSHARHEAKELLRSVGLIERLLHKPNQMSGGEQQRVALCRALANQPKILLADEPTGNLDSASARDIFNILMDLVRKTGMAAIIATHNVELVSKLDRVIKIEAGHLVPVQI